MSSKRSENVESSCNATRSRRSVTSAELLGQGNELIIQHAGAEYRLRITKQEKLILTK